MPREWVILLNVQYFVLSFCFFLNQIFKMPQCKLKYPNYCTSLGTMLVFNFAEVLDKQIFSIIKKSSWCTKWSKKEYLLNCTFEAATWPRSIWLELRVASIQEHFLMKMCYNTCSTVDGKGKSDYITLD